MSHSLIRVACSLAVVCGVSLRHMALLFSALCLIPMTKSSLKRWMHDIGANVPHQEEIRRPLLALSPALECHIAGDYPLGTDHCGMVVKEAHDRIRMTHDAVSEHGDDARPLLHRLKDCGLQVPAACSDSSPSFTAALKAV
jgi:hypothetical protein